MDTDSSQPEEWIKPKKARRQTTQQGIAGAKAAIQIQNGFESLDEEEDKENSVNEDTPTSKPNKGPAIKEGKPPPIHVCNTSLKAIIKQLEDNGILKGNFLIKQNDSINHTISSKNLETYMRIKTILNELNNEYYTYTPKALKPKTMILKGIRGDFTEKDIEEEIREHQLTQVEVKKIIKIIFNKNKPENYHYLVQLSHNSIIAELKTIKTLAYQPIKWEVLKKKEIFQCKNCQRLDHASANCKLQYRCVKCANSHKPGECTISQNADKSLLRCANCGEQGHPASYRGCPFLKFATNLKKSNKSNQIMGDVQKTNRLSRVVSQQIPYAEIVARKKLISNNEVSYQEMDSNEQNMTKPCPRSENNNGTDQAPKWMDNFKKEIMSMFNGQLQNITNKILINSSKIDYLFETLGIEC